MMNRRKLNYRVDLDFVGLTSAAKAYGGKLEAWSFINVKGEEWFSDFRKKVLASIGKNYLPIYRMADGEYRFLMGRKYNFRKKPLIRELIAVTAEKIRIKNPNQWKTSWGEQYAPHEVNSLRCQLIDKVKAIANEGYLACYINDNGLHAFTEYNKYLESFFREKGISFSKQNYIPFHFVVGLLVNEGWAEFYKDRNILIVSGTDENSEEKIARSLVNFGAKNVEFLRISQRSSMQDTLDLKKIMHPVDIALVAAGIGSANIITQLKPLQTVVMDIGGYINCYGDHTSVQHGGIFRLPNSKAKTSIVNNKW